MLNTASGNMYPFITHTWNPVKGTCPYACSYCYMKAVYKRFHIPPSPLHLDEKELCTNLGSGRFIFIGSSCDLFADAVPDEVIECILKKVRRNGENNYLFQTRNLIRVNRFSFPFHTFIAATLETNRTYEADSRSAAPSVTARVEDMQKCLIKKRFITIEPIMDFDVLPFVKIIENINPLQVVIGADSGYNNLPEPPKEKIRDLITELRTFTSVVCKKNLSRISSELIT